MQTFTIIFVIALILTTYLRIWLSSRHVRHIQSHRDSVPDEFLTQIDLASHQKAADYTCSKTRLGYINTLIEALLLLGLTLGGGLNALSTLWSEWLGISTSIDGHSADYSITHGVALIISTVMMMSLVEIPLSYYRTFVIEQRFGFNKMTPGMFFADLVKQTTLGVLIGTPLLLGILWLMKEMGDHWWLYAWFAWMGFNLLILAVYPTWIAPLFNKFTPLTDDALKSRIEQLMHKCGFESSGLFVMDGSRRSNHGNAYFTGFGRTKRIVFFDTLLSRLDPPEIEAVLAHELGHFKRRHVIKRIILSFIMSLVFLWGLGQLMQQEWFYQGLGVDVQFIPSTAMALLLFFLAMPVFTLLLQPLSSLYSRRHEFEADEYAADKSSASDLIRALVKLYQDNASTLTPDPLHSAFYDSHPPASLRIARLQKLTHH
ncbi:MAG: M48 family metallopeptidase [Nitrosomonadaceae bacterium]|nr:M48 family metallopeptidase [Nitrosospira sp.]MDW7565292.1 M48 family metallopeptidase [Nitrosomonadaceae bacterium]MBI0412349.1 M48 family metallopeptidase [Nitrosospira sp.]MBI0420942.1 M48 family metallopeptidase [Nitrosospira sp.]MDW7598546.1 M48 family metallopeptidase [Nitrosomonadaceae bacterium]